PCRDVKEIEHLHMDKWFRKIVAESSLPEDVARQLRNVGFVVIEGPVAHTKLTQFSEAYDAAVSAAHPDDISIRSSTRVHAFVNRGQAFDELYMYRLLLPACGPASGRPF